MDKIIREMEEMDEDCASSIGFLAHLTFDLVLWCDAGQQGNQDSQLQDVMTRLGNEERLNIIWKGGLQEEIIKVVTDNNVKANIYTEIMQRYFKRFKGIND